MSVQSSLLAELREKIIQHLNDSELRDLVFDLGLDYDMLSGHNKGDKTRELIAACVRENRLPDLLAWCATRRPDATWPTLSQPVILGATNPFYTNGRIHDPHFFFGRQQLLRELTSELKKRSSLSIVGQPQIGKSSLLYHLYNLREQWGSSATVIFLDLQRVLDEADFCAEVLTRLGEPGDTLGQLKRVLLNREVVLLLDEVERLAEADFNPRLHDLLRALAQEPHFALCLATQSPLADLFPARTPGGVSPFHNIFTGKVLGPFTAHEAREFLAARLAGSPIQFTQAETAHLLAESGGHPGKLQRLAKALYTEKEAELAGN